MPPLVRASFFHQEQTTDVGRIPKSNIWTYFVHFLFFRREMNDGSFLSDVPSLLRPGVAYDAGEAHALVESELLTRL